MSGSFGVQSTPIAINGQNLNGGIDLTYGLGPSVGQSAQTAYQFLNASNTQDQLFLQQSIAGTQTFLSHQLTPMADAVISAQTTADNNLPSMINAITQFSTNLLAGNQAMANSVLQSQNQQSANYAAANSGGGGGGGCFITTAICASENKPDDCEELQILRAFRDDYMMQNKGLRKMIIDYYDLAPKIVKRADTTLSDNERKIFYAVLREKFLDDCLKAISEDRYDDAVRVYAEMVAYAQRAVGRGI